MCLFISLDDHKLDLGPGADDLFPDAVNSQLTRWKALSLSEAQVCKYLYIRPESFYYPVFLSILDDAVCQFSHL